MYKELYKRLFLVSKQAGVGARMLQEGILNEGKIVKEQDNENEYHKAMREAKTKVDEIIQEMILQSLYPDYKDILTLDVEEDTKSKRLFRKQDIKTTLVLDPIDGTLDYIQQKDTYSICSAILQDHDIKLAIVYFPARDELYGYCEGMGTLYYHNVLAKNYEDGECLSFKPQGLPPNIIYKNARLSTSVVEKLSSLGFDVIDDQEDHIGCPFAILKCLKGEALAYFSDTRNIRDLFLGAILGKMRYGHCYTYQGKIASWESHGRQPEIVFSLYEKEKIFK